MVISNLAAGQKDHLIVKGIAKGLEVAEDKTKKYLNEDDIDEDIDLENDPKFETVEKGKNYTVYHPKSQNNDKRGENMPNKEAPEFVEEIDQELDDLEKAVDRKDTATAERQAEEVKEGVYDLMDQVDEVEDAFQQYDESMRENMDEWTDRLQEYATKLDQMNSQAHNAARDLMETARALDDYELDDRTEELIDIAYDL